MKEKENQSHINFFHWIRNVLLQCMMMETQLFLKFRVITAAAEQKFYDCMFKCIFLSLLVAEFWFSFG